jgi:Domain of unknown function (DUF4824)
MNILARKKVLAAGIALFILTNIIVISGAMYNRTGEPESLIEFSERELTINDWQKKENSGLSLQLNWNQYTFGYGNYYHQFSDEKLLSLGYDLIDSKDRDEVWEFIRKQLPRSVWVVLEFNGESYQNKLREAEKQFEEDERLYSLETSNEQLKRKMERSQNELKWEKNSSSRLFAIDVGNNPEQLRQQYPDKSRYIITSGIIRLSYNDDYDTRINITGYISDINVTNIHVPLEHRTEFDALPEKEFITQGNIYPLSFKPRYQVRIGYGKRYEPWIMSAKLLD